MSHFFQVPGSFLVSFQGSDLGSDLGFVAAKHYFSTVTGAYQCTQFALDYLTTD